MQFKHCTESQITMSLLMTPEHSNFGGKIHGGYILMLMDQIAFACASKHSSRYCVTASVNKVDFLHPVEVGELLHLKASINYTGTTSMVVGLRIETENILTGQREHCNSSYFTMVARNEDGTGAKVPGLLLTSLDEVRRFARSIERKHQAEERAQDFLPSAFKLHEHLEEVTSSNAKLALEGM